PGTLPAEALGVCRYARRPVRGYPAQPDPLGDADDTRRHRQEVQHLAGARPPGGGKDHQASAGVSKEGNQGLRVAQAVKDASARRAGMVPISTPAVIRPLPTHPMASRRSPRTSQESHAAKAGSSAKIKATRWAGTCFCAHTCTQNASAVASTPVITSAQISIGVKATDQGR